ncbi:MAG: glycosyltransferase [Chitinophagales bacterium]|nr:glycosyltransferase [Chitinophagales bacterium]
MKRIIFHLPYKIDKNRPSGTNIRPIKLLNAFKSLGYQVDFVNGYAKERKSQIEKIIRNIKSGITYDFLYSESSTLPTLLTESHHLPTYPFLDFNFLFFCKKNKIPIGLFYRDIHWEFEHYSLKGVKQIYSRIFYKFDLLKYNQLIDVLFLPSLKMFKHIPTNLTMQKFALPSGIDAETDYKPYIYNKVFIYVGGIGKLYKMHELIKAFQLNKDLKLILNTREEEWNQYKNEYQDYLSDNIEIHHKSGKDLLPLYKRSSVGLLVYEQSDYRNFAMPVKLFEYLSHNLLVLSSINTAPSEYIEKHKIGYSVNYHSNDISKLLLKLPNLVEQDTKLSERLYKIKKDNTWEARAKKVLEVLKNNNND